MKHANAFHRVLARRFTRIFMAGASVLALSSLWLVTAPTASAQVSFQWCEQSGSFCIGAANLVNFDPVSETSPGRLLFSPMSGTSNNFKLEFVGASTECVAASNSGTSVVIHPCNGVNVVWIPTSINGNNGSELLENAAFPGEFLSGDDHGHQFLLKSMGLNGWFQRFNTR